MLVTTLSLLVVAWSAAPALVSRRNSGKTRAIKLSFVCFWYKLQNMEAIPSRKFEQLEPYHSPGWYFERDRWPNLGAMLIGLGLTLSILFHMRWAYYAFALPGVALDLGYLYGWLRRRQRGRLGSS